MTNNDILIRLRYALNIKDSDMVEIFRMGGIELTKAEVQKMLINPKKNTTTEVEKSEPVANEELKICDNFMLESFLNGLIISQRGRKETTGDATQKPELMIKNDRSVNNVLLKKVKIALSLTSDDILDMLDEAGVRISNSELSAVLRKEGHRNYKECGDRYARNFLKGLVLRYRG
ncbi:DUF1456 family protein [Carnobacterium maltaromaticum]|uniref:DUF1456 family protein n=1 Tax=Carnobacterium maltaromaticum TaxID=2751 RepID=UPI000C78792F|nr:DUF1456 family protein [Carnobacterium maltaromaticum]PLS42587.1 DUF1456 domain-containing protein [Carnobacterium maltaromaticum]PLS45877.1 DUF1456 domain-containing protein [Carnobacterium maltaromaticum]